MMSSPSFPQWIEPIKWAEQGYSWSGDIPLERFNRIASESMVTAHNQHIHVQCTLTWKNGMAWLNASLKVSLPMQCQRCLEPVNTLIVTHVQLALLEDAAQAERLDEEADYIILSEEHIVHPAPHPNQMDLLALLEDELLLSVPLAPRHEDCDYTVPTVVIADEETLPERKNPFEILATLKQNRS